MVLGQSGQSIRAKLDETGRSYFKLDVPRDSKDGLRNWTVLKSKSGRFKGKDWWIKRKETGGSEKQKVDGANK